MRQRKRGRERERETEKNLYTRHVHHPAVALADHLAGLTKQATGADAVCVVALDHLLTGGTAISPGLGQVGQLSTETMIRALGVGPMQGL